MDRALGLTISSLFLGMGVAGAIHPGFLRSSLEERYTPARARAAAMVALLTALAGLWAILNYRGGPIDFSPV